MDQETNPFAYTDGDVDTNNTNNEHLWDLIQQRYSRRDIMSGTGAACAAFLGTGLLSGCNGDDDVAAPVGPAQGTISAGQDITTSSGRTVNLQATLFNATLTGFTQTGGPAVTVTNPNTPNASFLAPSVNVPTQLTFRVAGTNNLGEAVNDEVLVIVNPAQLGFNSLAKNLADVVTVPEGYTVTVLYRGGDPILPNTAAFANDGTDTNWGRRAGDHHDGIYYYGLNAAGNGRDLSNSTRGLLAMNHENLNDQYLHVNGPTAPGGIRPASEAIKEIEAHGVSVVEVSRSVAGVWSYSPASTFNRRITPNTPVEFTGPVRGNPLLRTLNGPTGTTGRGTINNCAFGFFLWGTYMTCEENWAGYFRRPASDDANRSPRELTSLRRYGVGGNGNYGWATVTGADATANGLDPAIFARWNAAVDITKPADGTGDYRYEPWQYGWCVEFDPYDPAGVIKKRTAMGRMGHEGAWHGSFRNGQKFAVYLGDDARGEYFYKFVSTETFASSDIQRQDRMAVSDKYFDSGTLYVARFNANGTGTWIPLTFGQVPNRPAAGLDPVYVFADQADILMNARLAGDAVGATKMDRPEWTATDNRTGEIYLTLTNNNAALRPLNGTDAANPRHYNDPRGATNQFGNPNGHILRLRETGDDNAALTFSWDIYLFGADAADASAANVNLSGLTGENDFSSPDGAWFSRPTNAAGAGNRQLLWIQTDDGAFVDRTNNQMLAALPGNTGDGGPRTITNVGNGGATATQSTIVGAAATSATLRRFMIGPRQCELTGVDSTPDGRTLFVNIQHPGENGTPAAPSSNWPQTQATGTGTGRPRSATIVVTKNDGGVVGL